MNRRHALVAALAVLITGTAGAVALAQDSVTTGRIGSATNTLGNGRHLQPFGKLVELGNFPTGGAVTPDGRFLWTVSTGRGRQDIRIVSVRKATVTQVLPIPGASGGIAMDPNDRLVYVSGVSGSEHKDQQLPPGSPGIAGDVIHVYRYDADGRATFDHLIGVPPQANAPTPQNFPPTNTEKIAWPDRLAISPDGGTLLVPLNLADTAAVVNVKTKGVRYVATGHYPYGAAILRNGKYGLVSNETPGTVSVVDLASATKVKDIQVGSHLSHPEAIALDPDADRAYVAIANTDQVAVIDTKRLALDRTLWVGRSEGLGTSPTHVSVTPDGTRLLVAESGADELAVFALPGHVPQGASAYSLIGRIPTSAYPAAVAATGKDANPCGFEKAKKKKAKKKHKAKKKSKAKKRKRAHRSATKKPAKHKKKKPKAKKHKKAKKKKKAVKTCAKLLYVSGKGVGTGPNPSGPRPDTKEDSDDLINSTQYLPVINFGAAGIADFPTDRAVRAQSRVADSQIRPVDPQQPPPGTPLRAGGPIKHVFYIVRENRTYDQVLGDDPRGDGDPSLTLFGKQITPNAHSLVQRFPLIDHFYANSEASIDGHFWTAAANVSDYVHKNWFQNYGGRKRPYDFGVYSVTWPGNGFLFDQAERQGISYYNYGEAIAGVVPSPTTVGPQIPFDDKDRTNEENLRVLTKLTKTDLNPGPGCYSNDASVGTDAITMQPVFDSSLPIGGPVPAHSRFDCFRLHFTAQLATGTVPSFSYLVLTNDHTRVLSPGAYTPRAMVADNDLGLGQIVDLITHSSIWKDSAIFVLEDDSQDGADHVDAHRTVGMVISPYAKRGAVIHTRYDFLSMIRSLELILGMQPLSLGDALATPMYDAFQSSPSNDAPYTAAAPGVSLLEQNPSVNTFAARLSDRWMKLGTDRIPQRVADRLLWWSIHGMKSTPPPPGPNAVHESADPKDRAVDDD
jgi:DNA-binding beta-propeller fold protein YncE